MSFVIPGKRCILDLGNERRSSRNENDSILPWTEVNRITTECNLKALQELVHSTQQGLDFHGRQQHGLRDKLP
jgi:hypothetical protein